jgi:hypothetical protein
MLNYLMHLGVLIFRISMTKKQQKQYLEQLVGKHNSIGEVFTSFALVGGIEDRTSIRLSCFIEEKTFMRWKFSCHFFMERSNLLRFHLRNQSLKREQKKQNSGPTLGCTYLIRHPRLHLFFQTFFWMITETY